MEFEKKNYWNLICWIFFSISDSYQRDEQLLQKSNEDETNDSTDNSTWQPRIQSMVVQNDGSIILCDNDSELASRPRIEVVEILSPTNYIRGNDKIPIIFC